MHYIKLVALITYVVFYSVNMQLFTFVIIKRPL